MLQLFRLLRLRSKLRSATPHLLPEPLLSRPERIASSYRTATLANQILVKNDWHVLPSHHFCSAETCFSKAYVAAFDTSTGQQGICTGPTELSYCCMWQSLCGWVMRYQLLPRGFCTTPTTSSTNALATASSSSLTVGYQATEQARSHTITATRDPSSTQHGVERL